MYGAEKIQRVAPAVVKYISPKKKAAAVRFRAEHLDSERERRRASYVLNRERELARQRRYNSTETARTKRLEYAKKLYAKDPSPFAKRSAKWRAENKDRVRAMTIRRRARLAGAVSDLYFPEEIYKRDRGICGICGLFVEQQESSIDHVTPIARGGQNTRSNVQLAHRRCNSKKGTRLPTDPRVQRLRKTNPPMM